tara:strand:- start:2870 stop:3307 length:438 start_codon:yes stop_codon:yes gene_type:complete
VGGLGGPSVPGALAYSGETAAIEVFLVESEEMAQFMEVGDAYLLKITRFVSLAKVPKVLEEKLDLGRQGGNGGTVGKGVAAEEAEEVGVQSFLYQVFARRWFADHGEVDGLGLQFIGQSSEGGLHLAFGEMEDASVGGIVLVHGG